MTPTNIDSDALPISRYVNWMFIVFVIGFGLLFFINYYSSDYQERLDGKLENARVQGVLGSEIIQLINDLERNYYQITTQLNPLAREITLKRVEQNVDKILSLIDVLNAGGDFTQTIILNLPDQENVVKDWHYTPIQNLPYNILKIDILPKLVELKRQFKVLNAQMTQANKLYTLGSSELAEHMKNVQSLIKNTVPLFIRLLENTNRIQYEQQKYLNEISKSVQEQKTYFYWGTYIAMLLLFMLTIFTMFIISRNIRKLAEELNTQRNSAIAATESKSIFLANMSHEIRTPLNAITGFIALLKQDERDAKRLHYLNTIEDSSESLVGIINDILDFSKIESNKLDIDAIDFDPHRAFTAVAELFKARSAEKNLALNVHIDSKMPQSLHSDPLRIKQVLVNLLSNAIKFSPENKNIWLDISYDKQRKRLCVCVKDEGIGISSDQIQKIFQPFSQAECHTTRKFGGTGLGLTISRLLTELLGGELQVDSQIGVGSKFYFYVPVEEGLAPVHQAKDDPHQTFKGMILLVEDNATNQLLMSAILKKLGIEFELAKDGLEAVEAFKSKRFDMILMDENMPNMSGSQATQIIRKIEDSSRPIPIVSLTANAMKGDKERFLSIGMDDYLNKPIILTELKRVLSKYLKSS